MIHLCSYRDDVPFSIGDLVEWGYDNTRGVIVAFENAQLRSEDENSDERFTCLIAVEETTFAEDTLRHYVIYNRDDIGLDSLEDDSVLKDYYSYGHTWEDHTELTLIESYGREKKLCTIVEELNREVL